MKIHIDLPNGARIDIEREPMSEGKFWALIALAAGALVVVLFLGSVAIKVLG